MNQVLIRIISRLNECDEQDSSLIQGMVESGLGTCDRCGQWFHEADLVRAGDRSCCDGCFNWEHFYRESDDEETVAAVVPQLVKAIASRHCRSRNVPFMRLLPRTKEGILEEPFLTPYLKLEY